MAGLRVAVIGLGATGARAARQLASSAGIEGVVVRDVDGERRDRVAGLIGRMAIVEDRVDVPVEVTVLATPHSTHRRLAAVAMAQGSDVVSVSDSIDDVRALFDLAPEAAERGRTIIAGAGFSPGLSCLLARVGGQRFDEVHEIRVARFGTGGPSCARQRHRALQARSLDWRDGTWLRRPSGSGRELHFFPDPVGGADCYRAALPDAILLRRAFPAASRLSARLAATRRDRLTFWLPMLRPPHPEGQIGAVRSEVIGTRAGVVSGEILGAVDRPAVAAGGVAAVLAYGLATGRADALRGGTFAAGEWPDLEWAMRELYGRGIKGARFAGPAHAPVA